MHEADGKREPARIQVFLVVAGQDPETAAFSNARLPRGQLLKPFEVGKIVVMPRDLVGECHPRFAQDASAHERRFERVDRENSIEATQLALKKVSDVGPASAQMRLKSAHESALKARRVLRVSKAGGCRESSLLKRTPVGCRFARWWLLVGDHR